MKMMQPNWKRSLATFALLAAFNGPDATVVTAQPDKPEPPAAPVPAVAPVAPASAAADAFRKRYGLDRGSDGATPIRQAGHEEKAARGAQLEAKLKQIVLPEVTFDGLPLGEVLRFLSDESVKRDPEKTGVNFLINPNFRPVSLTGAVDPATGLPLAAPAEQFDMSAVVVKFNLPLRNVTMKDVLDAIVTVADHPIEYTLEDYAVVFSAKPETVGGQPVILAHAALVPQPARASGLKPAPLPMVVEEPSTPGTKPEPPGKRHWSEAELSDVMPQPFNLDFGSGTPSEQVGPAAVGRAGDFWNGVAIPFNNHHTESDLKFAGGDPCPIEVEMINLGGCWASTGGEGLKSPMLNSYNYPTGNRGGNSTVILRLVPAGKYNVYVYGFGPNPAYYGDYTLTVGTHNYGRKKTQQKKGTVQDTKWVEGSQYVKFSSIKVGAGDEVEILIQPGAMTSDAAGRTFADAMICGLQLIPVDRPRMAATGFQASSGRPGGVPLPAGLVSWWPGETDGTDLIGHNPGKLLNGATCAPGKVGRAFDLDGSRQYVDVPDSASLNPSQRITVEAWIYPRLPLDPVAAPIIKKAGGGGTWGQDNGYALELYGPEEVRFGVYLDGNQSWNLTDSAPLSPNKWSHVAGVYDGERVSFYVNGELVGTPLAVSGRIVPSGHHLQIGHDPSSPERYFNGLIDEASVYNTALSAEQIRAIYKAGSAGKRRPTR